MSHAITKYYRGETMERFFAVFMMAVVFIYPAVTMAQSQWEMCLEQSQNFRQLPKVDEELGPMMTLPERIRQMAKQIEIFASWEKMQSPEDKQQMRIIRRGNVLIQNCTIWSALGDLIVIARTNTANLEKWRTYLEEREQKGLSRLPINNDPEQLLQQATALRQRLEHFDPTQPYQKQMDPSERKWFEDLRREVLSMNEPNQEERK